MPLILRWNGWLTLMAGGGVGGAIVGLGVAEMWAGENWYLLPGHVTWEVLVCLALYYGSRRSHGKSTPAIR